MTQSLLTQAPVDVRAESTYGDYMTNENQPTLPDDLIEEYDLVEIDHGRYHGHFAWTCGSQLRHLEALPDMLEHLNADLPDGWVADWLPGGEAVQYVVVVAT